MIKESASSTTKALLNLSCKDNRKQIKELNINTLLKQT